MRGSSFLVLARLLLMSAFYELNQGISWELGLAKRGPILEVHTSSAVTTAEEVFNQAQVFPSFHLATFTTGFRDSRSIIEVVLPVRLTEVVVAVLVGLLHSLIQNALRQLRQALLHRQSVQEYQRSLEPT